MKFTKTAVAVAIAGIAAAPMIATADTVLSGAVQIMLVGQDEDNAATPIDEKDLTMVPDDVLFGINAAHTLNSGLTGYGNLRVDLNSLSNANTSGASGSLTDSVYVGMKGGFGDVRFGEIPLAVEYGQLANDIHDIGGEVNGGMSYTGNFGPVGLIANFSLQNNSEVIGLGAKFNMAGFGIGIGAEERAELQNASAGLSYSIAGVNLAAHAWTREVGGGADDAEGFAATAGYGAGNFSGKLTYARHDTAEEDVIRLDLAYDLGGSMEVSTRITNTTNDLTDADGTAYRVKLSKSF